MKKTLITTIAILSLVIPSVASAGIQTWPWALSTTTTSIYPLPPANTYKVGFGTTTPWGLLSVNPNALGSGVPEFVIGSSTATHLIVNGAGNVGIGTNTPSTLLQVGGNTATVTGGISLGTDINIYRSGTKALTIDPSNGGDVTFPEGNGNHVYFNNSGQGVLGSIRAFGGIGFLISTEDTNNIVLAVNTVSKVTVSSTGVSFANGATFSGNIGIGTTTPAATLGVQGNALISGNLTSVSNIIATGTLTVAGNTGIGSTSPGTLLSLGNTGGTNISVTGTSTFATGINLSGGCITLQGGSCIGGTAASTGKTIDTYGYASSLTLTQAATTSSVTSGNSVMIWARCLAASNNTTPMRLEAFVSGKGTTTLDAAATTNASSGTRPSNSLLGIYTASSTGNLFIAIDDTNGALFPCSDFSIMLQRFTN